MPDLNGTAHGRRSALLPAFRSHLVRAVSALPLHLGVIGVGALTGRRAAAGPLTRARMAPARPSPKPSLSSCSPAPACTTSARTVRCPRTAP
ncbi:hypothetical protein [Streptomyces sp. NPDC052225]|uniref:hypothetical protein n=1 Tax=Streptomyces sp. NPDC052225 TaxID=3154949 RepID=UPI00341C2BEF